MAALHRTFSSPGFVSASEIAQDAQLIVRMSQDTQLKQPMCGMPATCAG